MAEVMFADTKADDGAFFQATQLVFKKAAKKEEAMKKAGTNPATGDQKTGIIAALKRAIPATLTDEAAELFISNPRRLIAGVRGVFQETTRAIDYKDFLEDWGCFYKEAFGITANFSDLVIPKKIRGFNWFLPRLKGQTASELFANCSRLFPVQSQTDNLNAIESVRTAEKTSYAVWVRDVIEANDCCNCSEERFVSIDRSCSGCSEKRFIGITLEEYLLLVRWYYWKTGKHLDTLNSVKCSGSRFLSGFVPLVGWINENTLKISFYSPGQFRVDTRYVVSI